MKVLLCNPGADSSTIDVFNGLLRGLEQQGHEVIQYHLSGHVDSMGAWLNWQWRRAGKPEPRPNHADVIYLASTPILERVLRFLPDWVVLTSVMYMHPDVLLMLKRLGCNVAYVFTESPYDLAHELARAPLATAVFTNERSVVETFRGANLQSYYLPAAYDPEMHAPGDLHPDIPRHDVVLVATGFQERIDTLAAIDWDGIDLGLYGTWNLMGSRSKLRQYVRSTQPIPNRAATMLYRAAKIGLNLYRTSIGYGHNTPKIVSADSMNPRAYELAAAGIFQVSDYRTEIDETFGSSVPTFRTPKELGDIVRLALADEGWRIRMADEARQKIRRHTWGARVMTMIECLEEVAQERSLRIVSRDGINPRAEVAV